MNPTLPTIIALLFVPLALSAQAPTTAEPTPMPVKGIELLEPLPDGTTTIEFRGIHSLEPLNRYLRPFLAWGIGTAAGLTILMIIIGGFQYILAGGESGGTQAAKDRIKAAIFGLLLLMLSAVILNFLNASYFTLGP